MRARTGRTASGERGFGIACIFLVAAACLYPLLRLYQTGHLITWDEAMNICSARAFVSLGKDDFSNWFWRHPPLYSLLTMLLQPLKPGFIMRVEIFNIVLGALNLVLLFFLNRKLFGLLTASISIFILATIPGSIFFDMWIKRDHLAITFALLSLWLIHSKRLPLASLAAGLGFLSKETFIFLFIPVVLSALSTSKDKRRLPGIGLILAVPVLASCWWYIVASRTGELSSIRDHIAFATAGGRAWAGGPAFYPSLILTLLGPLGLILLAAGFFTAARKGITPLIWPISPIVITILGLSIIPPKVPWLVIVLMPCLATTQAIALSASLAWLQERGPKGAAQILPAIAAAGLIALPAFGHSHEAMLRVVTPQQYRGASRSRNLAQMASGLIRDSDRLLLSSFHYWKGVAPGQMCPVFTCYFEPKPLVLPVPHETPFEELIRLIAKHDINWAIVSPEPGIQEEDVIGGFIRDVGLIPASTGYACIFDTSEILKRSVRQSGVLDEIPEPAE